MICFSSCPNLLELSILGTLVEGQLDFRKYRKIHSELPSIICNWQDIVPLSVALMDAQSIYEVSAPTASPFGEQLSGWCYSSWV